MSKPPSPEPAPRDASVASDELAVQETLADPASETQAPSADAPSCSSASGPTETIAMTVAEEPSREGERAPLAEAPDGLTPPPGPPGEPAATIAQDATSGPPPQTDGRRSPDLGEPPTMPSYEILDELGRGGMGVVYQARQVGLNRLVALKMMLAGAHASPEQRARFHLEVQAVAQLQHPNIVQIYDVGEQDGLPYCSLEYVDGGSLAEKIDGKPQPPEEAARLVEVLAGAIHRAHERRIVHRDLKPANVLLTSQGVPKITDFGLAKCLESEAVHTRSGSLMGTPSYMAPEQAGGRIKEIGPATDVYALGAILYELLTGRPPFKAASVTDTVLQVLKDEPVPPRRLVPKTPRDLETICLKCLQKEPRKRYGSTEELADDLHRFLSGAPIRARPVSALEQVWRWCRRNPSVAALSAALLVLLVAVALGSTVAAIRIDHERQNAVAARQLAEQNAEQARQSQQRADESAQFASLQRDLALGALGTLVSEVQTQLEDTPATHTLKQNLLETALAGLRTIAESTGDSTIADLKMAEAHRRMGKLFELLGHPREAHRQYQQCHAILEALADDDLEGDLGQKNLAVSHTLLGDSSLLLGDRAAARASYQHALELRQTLAEADPHDAEAKSGLAVAFIKLGHVSDAEPARRFYREALRLRQELAEASPQDPRALRDLWIAHAMLGDSSLRLGDPTAALDSYWECLRLAQELVAIDGDSYRFYQDLAASHEKLSRAHAQLGEIQAAQEHDRDALALLRPLAEQDPRNLPVQTSLALVLARTGRHAEAAETAETLRHLAPESRGNLCNVACCYALCKAAVERGRSHEQLTIEEQQLSRRYADAAIEALRQAIAHGLSADDRAYLESDPDLDPIRQDPAFAALLDSLE